LAIEITGRTAGNDVVEGAMARMLDSVKSGGTIAIPLREAPEIFPPAMVCQMGSVGDAMFAKIADLYDDQVDAALKALTSILEPAMIIIIGCIVGFIVGFIVISMYLPLFEGTQPDRLGAHGVSALARFRY
jgi:type IV pilus assembly protein PilC